MDLWTYGGWKRECTLAGPGVLLHGLLNTNTILLSWKVSCALARIIEIGKSCEQQY